MASQTWVAPMAEEIGTLVAGKQVTPPLPPGAQPMLSGDDAGAEFDGPRDDPGPISALALFIEYRDAKGAVTQRRISCLRLEQSEYLYLVAFCHERNALRSFRVDRMIEVVDVRTGEIHEPWHLFHGMLERGLSATDIRLQKILIVLTFIMRCDGLVHPAEEEVLEQTVRSFIMTYGGDDDDYEAGLKLAGSLAPDANDFMGAMRFIASGADNGRLARFLTPRFAAMIEADGWQSEEEFYYASVVFHFLRRAAGE